MKRTAIGAALVTGLALAGCASPPPHHAGRTVLEESPADAPPLPSGASAASDAAGGQEPALLTPEDDARVGAEQAKRAAAEYGLVEDPALAAYVSAVGQRLARNAPGSFTYQFQVVDQSVPNAFALPGGYVFVTRGLLVLVNSEDELANVMGHEITHVAERHAAMQQAVAASPTLDLPKAVAMAGAGVDLANGQLGESRQAWLARYGRDQEADADRIGQRIAAASGWDPQQMGVFLRDLDAEMRLQQGTPQLPGFLDSHPSDPDRITNAALNASMLQRNPEPPIAADRAAFLGKLDGLVVGDDTSGGVVQDSLFLQPQLGFALQFPEGWEVQNTNAAVAAVSPDREIEILLETQGPGHDAKAAADAWFAKAPPGASLVRQGGTPLAIAGAPAWHERAEARSKRGVLPMDVTWIAFGGTIYRITGLAPGVVMAEQGDLISGVARSFRAATPAETSGLRVRRLRIGVAKAGESVSDFTRRSKSAWTPSELAVANGLFSDATLEEGQVLKIAVDESWQAPDTGAGGR